LAGCCDGDSRIRRQDLGRGVETLGGDRSESRISPHDAIHRPSHGAIARAGNRSRERLLLAKEERCGGWRHGHRYRWRRWRPTRGCATGSAASSQSHAKQHYGHRQPDYSSRIERSSKASRHCARSASAACAERTARKQYRYRYRLPRGHIRRLQPEDGRRGKPCFN
jgi:hypothetical protein